MVVLTIRFLYQNIIDMFNRLIDNDIWIKTINMGHGQIGVADFGINE